MLASNSLSIYVTLLGLLYWFWLAGWMELLGRFYPFVISFLVIYGLLSLIKFGLWRFLVTSFACLLFVLLAYRIYSTHWDPASLILTQSLLPNISLR